MSYPKDGTQRDCDPPLEQHVAVAELLLHNLRDLRSCHLSPRHYDLMLVLKTQRRGHERTLAELAALTNSDGGVCASSLRQLRKRGLVRTRSRDAHHPQGTRLTLKGETLLRRLSRRDRARWLRLAPSLLSSLQHPEDLE